jgi:hypothetical protein
MLFELPQEFNTPSKRKAIYEDYMSKSGDLDSAEAQLDDDLAGNHHVSKLSKDEKKEYKINQASKIPIRREGLAAMTLRDYTKAHDAETRNQQTKAHAPVDKTKSRPQILKRPRG